MIQIAAAPAPDRLADIWAQLQGFVSGVLALDPEQAAIRAGLSLLIIVGAALIVTALRMLLKAAVERIAPGGEDDTPKARARIGRWTLRLARIVIAFVAIYLILHLWGFDFGVLNGGPLGAALRSLARVALILTLAFAAVELTQIALARMFSRVAARSRNERRAAQVRTLAPLLSGVAATAIIIIASSMALSEFGVEIGPLIAGAGIVGLAVGFGAQTLVKDFLTGVFLIIEDIVSVGDVARIGAASGVVEEMSLRTIKLRAFDGTLFAIPYGEAQVIANLTKNFSFYVFELSISYSSDIAKALELMRETGAALQSDADFGAFIMEPIEVVGVDKLGDSGVVLKARIKTLPGKQWGVGREFLKRIKLVFDANRIEIPFPHVKLVPPDAPIPLDENRPAPPSDA